MVENTFLVAIDAWNTKHDVSSVRDFIRTSPQIDNWWNYIPYVFLIATPLGADELAEALKVHTKDASLLVVEANPRNSQGLLPESAWKWIDQRAQQSAASYSGLAGAATPAGTRETNLAGGATYTGASDATGRASGARKGSL